MKRTLALGVLTLGVVVYQWAKRPSTPSASTRLNSVRAHQVAEPARAPGGLSAPIEVRAVADEVRGILNLQGCYESQSCAYPQEDPRSYEIALGHDIQNRLLQFARTHENAPEDRKILAQAFIANPDPFVQEACLTLFAGLPIEESNLKAITQALKDSPDPEVMAQTLIEMNRYLGSPWEAQVHSFLSEVVARGGQLTSETVALQIMPFVSENSLKTYQQTLRGMNQDSIAYGYLETALQEYQRLKSGG